MCIRDRRENDVKAQVFNLLNQAEIPYMEKVAIMEILDKKISDVYKRQIQLKAGETVLDTREYRIGLRTVCLLYTSL